MKRAVILLLDSLGVGSSEDAGKYGDAGANTLGHIVEKFPNIKIPNLVNLGLGNILQASCHNSYGLNANSLPNNYYGFAKEVSAGKDTTTGHWELMGCPVKFDWGYFKDEVNPFPSSLLEKILSKYGVGKSIGNCSGSGTEIIAKYGEEHLASGHPIFYTSADSVFQIACHEEVFGLENLYKICKIAREELYSYNIGRVIARPFIGNNASNFKRTNNRKDYSITPPAKTLLDVMKDNGGEVISIGKISDIFAGSGITKAVKSATLENLFNNTIEQIKLNNSKSIIFTNFVDFDSEYGHRRDIKGYKEALEYFDSRLPEIMKVLKEEDLLVIIADHGCDPSWQGSDHTREHIPIIFHNKYLQSKNIGKRDTFADVGQSIATYLQLPKLQYGKSFL